MVNQRFYLMERKLNKKVLLATLKFSPWLIGIIYLIEIILSCFGIQLFVLHFICSASILPLLVILLFSFSLNYCFWHRFPIYITISNNVINFIDYYIGIPIYGKWMLIVYLISISLIALIGSYVKNKKNVKERNIKENSVRYS